MNIWPFRRQTRPFLRCICCLFPLFHQMMSMGNGLYMPPMMFPTGIQRIHPSQMAQFSPMGIGMGLGMGMVGLNCGTHVPMPYVSSSTTLHSTVAPNFPLMGLPGQGLPMSTPCLSTLVPFPGVPLVNSGTGPKTSTFGGPGTMESTDPTTTSSLKESMRNVNSASCVTNHTSSQVGVYLIGMFNKMLSLCVIGCWCTIT